eukprot:6198662-Pleurochrysis_carterae.AAC.1
MDDADDADNVAAAPSVVAGMDINSDCDNTAPAAGIDDLIASRVRRHGAPRPVLPDTAFAFNPHAVYCTPVLCEPAYATSIDMGEA